MTHPIPGFYEPISAILHLAAAAVFAILGVRLVVQNKGDRPRAVMLVVFALAAVFMLSMSAVYHMLARGSTGSEVMVRLDHAAIFVLIAGTFTPIHGMLSRGAVRWAGLAMMWAAALTGVTLVTVFFDRMSFALSATLYLALGWSASLSVIAPWRRRGFRYVRPLIDGGLAYSIGAVLLGLGLPTIVPGVFGPHELWHVAVILGISLHWRFVVQLTRDNATTSTPEPRRGRPTRRRDERTAPPAVRPTA